MANFDSDWKRACGGSPNSATWPVPVNAFVYSGDDGLLVGVNKFPSFIS